MKVSIISGSSRSNNNTIRLAKAFAHEFREKGHDADIIDFKDYDLPFPNQGDVDPEHLTDFQKKLFKGFEESQIVLVLTPEYNWFPSAELVNMVHTLGSSKFSYLFDNKVFGFAGVSTGKGGRMPAVQLSYVFDKVISFFHKHSVTSSRKFESHFTTKMIDEDGAIHEEGVFKDAVAEFIEYNLTLAEKWFS